MKNIPVDIQLSTALLHQPRDVNHLNLHTQTESLDTSRGSDHRNSSRCLARALVPPVGEKGMLQALLTVEAFGLIPIRCLGQRCPSAESRPCSSWWCVQRSVQRVLAAGQGLSSSAAVAAAAAAVAAATTTTTAACLHHVS